MGLKSAIQKAAQAAVKATGDIPTVCDYWQIEEGASYTPYDGKVVHRGVKSASVSFIFTDFSQNDVDGDKVRSDDKQAMVPSLNLNCTPETDDRLHESDTVQWIVLKVDIDPADALWVLHIRRTTPKVLLEEF